MTRLIISLVIAIAGMAMLLAGLGIDAWLHAQDETLAAREGIFTLSNPAHLLLGLGITAMSGGVFAALYLAWGMTKARGILGRRWVRIISLQAAGAASLGAMVFALAVSASGHDHAHADAAAAAAHAHADGTELEHPDVSGTATDSADAVAGDGAARAATTSAPAHTHAADALPADAMASTAPHAHDDGRGPDGNAAIDTVAGAPATVMADDGAHPDDADAGDKHPHNHPTPTAEELACLGDLTAQAKAATVRFVDYEVAVAEGYRQPENPDGTHYPNRPYMLDGVSLDLGKPESLIYRTGAAGERRLIGALYKAPRGEGPQPCGNATWWHTHDGCIDPVARVPTEMPASGVCPEGTILREAPVEMMHLWFVTRRQG